MVLLRVKDFCWEAVLLPPCPLVGGAASLPLPFWVGLLPLGHRINVKKIKSKT